MHLHAPLTQSCSLGIADCISTTGNSSWSDQRSARSSSCAADSQARAKAARSRRYIVRRTSPTASSCSSHQQSVSRSCFYARSSACGDDCADVLQSSAGRAAGGRQRSRFAMAASSQRYPAAKILCAVSVQSICWYWTKQVACRISCTTAFAQCLRRQTDRSSCRRRQTASADSFTTLGIAARLILTGSASGQYRRRRSHALHRTSSLLSDAICQS
jgi:hypothetical protein